LSAAAPVHTNRRAHLSWPDEHETSRSRLVSIAVATLGERTRRSPTKGPIEIHQDDTFFRCDAGRLKLRTFANGEGELIFYRRSDQEGPQRVLLHSDADAAPNSLREALSLAYGQKAAYVSKGLCISRSNAHHLDIVENLGHFLEIEVVLREMSSQRPVFREAEELMQRLGVSPSQLIDRAYVDLLAERDCGNTHRNRYTKQVRVTPFPTVGRLYCQGR